MNNFYENRFHRGDIFYIERTPSCGSEQQSGRPAIIVSNDIGNEHSGTVELVYLTTQQKRDLPTHVQINSSTKTCVALCEQIHTVDKSRIGDYIGMCSLNEMESIDMALMISLGIDNYGSESEVVKEVEVIKEVPVDNAELKAELIAANAKNEQLQKMYESLLASILSSKNQ